jgi:hypothetical protein
MKKPTLPKLNILPHQVLSINSLSFLKGGATSTNESVNKNAVAKDDKRRERPGGGIAT